MYLPIDVIILLYYRYSVSVIMRALEFIIRNSLTFYNSYYYTVFSSSLEICVDHTESAGERWLRAQSTHYIKISLRSQSGNLFSNFQSEITAL